MKILRKPIKHIYLRLKRHGVSTYYVELSAPKRSSEKQLRAVVTAKLPWLLKQLERQKNLPAPVELKFEDGEEHFYLGRAYKLKIIQGQGAGRVVRSDFLELHVPSGASSQYRKNLLSRWYKNELVRIVNPMLTHWQGQMGVQASEWRLRIMKSRWGSCNTVVGRIWLNVELIKKPLACIEYVLVHELAHLIERGHGPAFWAVVERYLPDWKARRKALNASSIQG